MKENMSKIKELTDLGFKCPVCNSINLRSGYHEFQLWDSWICKDCGFRWREDLPNDKLFEHTKQALSNNTRLIWVLHSIKYPSRPILNSKSSDETTYDKFIEE